MALAKHSVPTFRHCFQSCALRAASTTLRPAERRSGVNNYYGHASVTYTTWFLQNRVVYFHWSRERHLHNNVLHLHNIVVLVKLA